MKTYIEFNPCVATKSFGSGFFSNYRVVLDLLMANEEHMDAKPYINWSDTVWVDGFNPYCNILPPKKYNPFDLWFDQEIPLDSDIIKQPQIIISHTQIDHKLDYFNDKVSLQKQRATEMKYIKLKDNLKIKIDEIFDKEFKGNTTLGIVARGCEFSHYHSEYGVFTIQDYIREIKSILSKNKQINKLFFVSEDSGYIQALKDAFVIYDHYYLPDAFRRTDESLDYMKKICLWPNVSDKRENQNKLLGEEVIIQTKLLGKCDYLFGSHNGIFAGAVLWGDNIKDIYKLS